MYIIFTQREMFILARKTSIRARILRMCIISVASVVTILMAAIVTMIYNAYDASYQNQADSLAAAYCQMFRNNIENLQLNIQSVQSRTDVLDETIPLEERKAKLADLASTSILKDFSVAYGDGTTYNNTDLTQREYFQTAMKGSYAISAPVVRLTETTALPQCLRVPCTPITASSMSSTEVSTAFTSQMVLTLPLWPREATLL